MNSVQNITIALESEYIKALDRLVAEGRFENRSHAIRIAVKAFLSRIKRRRLARECAKLDPDLEKAMAEERFFSGR